MSSTLSTLIADLVGETADGVHRAAVVATRRRAALGEVAGEPTDSEVTAALAALFPPLERPPVDLLERVLGDAALDEYVSGWRPGETSVRAGEVYLHPDLTDERVAEFPPIERELGVPVLESTDRGDGVARLTERSVAAVRRAVRERLAAERRTAAAAFADGVPTPVVESATVKASVAFGGDGEALEASLIDGRDPAVRPELAGRITADLRFRSLPAGSDGEEGSPPADESDTGDDDSDDADRRDRPRVPDWPFDPRRPPFWRRDQLGRGERVPGGDRSREDRR